MTNAIVMLDVNVLGNWVFLNPAMLLPDGRVLVYVKIHWAPGKSQFDLTGLAYLSQLKLSLKST